MNNPFRSPEFKALLNEWNQILKKDGFEDAEDCGPGDPTLKQWSSFKLVAPGNPHLTRAKIEEDQTYYEMAWEVLDRHRFKNNLHRLVWVYHCEGYSVRRISKELRFWLFRASKSKVDDIIISIQRESGLKNG